ncbi:MAG: hypothetical protein ACLSGI_04275 [Butyricicoccaceae bacterium]
MQGQTRACVCVLHYSAGTLQDKEYTFSTSPSDPAEVLSSFIKQYYAQRNAVAKTVLLSHEIEEQDAVGGTFHPSQSARSSWPCRSAANAGC